MPNSPRHKTALLGAAALTAGVAAPYAGEIGANTMRRYNTTLNDILTAKYKTPGDKLVTASVKSFTEKRAALQQPQKTAGIASSALTTQGNKVGPLLLNLVDMMGTNPWTTAVGGTGILAGASLLDPTLDAIAEKIKDRLVPTNLQDRLLDEGASSLTNSLSSQAGQGIASLFGNLLSKGTSSVTGIPAARARTNLFEQLKQDDDVLSSADPQALRAAYHTMTRFAPTLATDPNAVRSFLREATLYGSGPNVISIKQLADAEKTLEALKEYQ